MKLSEIEGNRALTAEDLISSIKNGRFTLDGSDLEIAGDFNCARRELKSLKGAPRKITGSFKCNGNELTSLDGAPEEVGGNFDCYNNRLTTLNGAPREVGGDFNCFKNIHLTTLDGAPAVVNGDFICFKNELTSLKDIHKHIKKINGVFDVAKNPIRSHVLGLLLINGLRAVELDNKDVERILNMFLPNTRGIAAVIEAQSALLDAGLEEYAQL